MPQSIASLGAINIPDFKQNVSLCVSQPLDSRRHSLGDYFQPRIIVGGQHRRWLNITRVVISEGVQDPDSKIFMCEVCTDRDTPQEMCNTSSYTNRVIGAPPKIIEKSSKIINNYRLLRRCVY